MSRHTSLSLHLAHCQPVVIENALEITTWIASEDHKRKCFKRSTLTHIRSQNSCLPCHPLYGCSITKLYHHASLTNQLSCKSPSSKCTLLEGRYLGTCRTFSFLPPIFSLRLGQLQDQDQDHEVSQRPSSRCCQYCETRPSNERREHACGLPESVEAFGADRTVGVYKRKRASVEGHSI